MPRYYAQIDDNNKVIQVIVAGENTKAELIDSGKLGDASKWIECEKKYTKGLGKQAGKGSTYDHQKAKFIGIKPHDSWVLNADDEWEAPISKQAGQEFYDWNETLQKFEPVDKTKTVKEA